MTQDKPFTYSETVRWRSEDMPKLPHIPEMDSIELHKISGKPNKLILPGQPEFTGNPEVAQQYKGLIQGTKADKKITIRPSSVSSFVSCQWQWYNVFVLGHMTIPSARAAIGTGVHKGAEVMWNEAMKTGFKDLSKGGIDTFVDAAVEETRAEAKNNELKFDPGEDVNTAIDETAKGTRTFMRDIAPSTDIPEAVEKRFTVKIEHDLVDNISGSIDYIGHGIIADIKTSKKKPTPANYTLQQSTYKFLAESNGVQVDRNLIQGVVMKKEQVGHILELEPNVGQAKMMINNILDKLDIIKDGNVDPSAVFTGNPNNFLCNPRYCNMYDTCPFVQGR